VEHVLLARLTVRITASIAVVLVLLGSTATLKAQSYDVIHAFRGPSTDPALPEASLMQASDGWLYGTSAAGGAVGDGTLFRISLAGNLEVVYSFDINGSVGAFPLAPVIQTRDGEIHGTLGRSGCNGGGGGYGCNPPDGLAAVQRTRPSNSAALARDFVLRLDGTIPSSGIRYLINSPLRTPFLQTADGSLLLPYTGFFAIVPPVAGFIDVRKATEHLNAYMPQFIGSNGPGDLSPLIQAADGNLYLTAATGSASSLGAIYKVTPTFDYVLMHEFAGGLEGAMPRSIIQAQDGNFYGVTESGGTSNNGTVFKMTAAGTVTIVHSFNGTDGRGPMSSLLQAQDGDFYGTTPAGGAFDDGVVYRMAADGTFTVLYSFGAGPHDGALPHAGVIQASDGNLYGTTKLGGHGVGTVFRMTPAGVVTTLAAFAGDTDGNTPDTPLTLASNGNLYGMTPGRESSNLSTLIRVGSDRQVTVVKTMDERLLAHPAGALTEGDDGFLYGVTSGAQYEVIRITGYGTVFRTNVQGEAAIVHEFAGGPLDGATPTGSLAKAGDGSFLGLTSGGGVAGLGTVFRLTPSGDLTILHSFGLVSTDGVSPQGSLVRNTDGTFYGVTQYGGPLFGGTIFRVTLDGVNVLHSFQSDEGSFPNSLVNGGDGYLYGTTRYGGPDGYGVAFRISFSGALTVVHRFVDSEGGRPNGPLLLASDGYFYATTSGSSRLPGGAIVKMSRTGIVIVQAALSGTQGETPLAGLVEGPDHALYGTTSSGGQFEMGVVFRLNPAAPPVPPTSVSRAVTSTGVRLTWATVNTATGYTIKRAERSGEEIVIARRVQGTTFVDTSAVRGRRYYYVVTAENSKGESGASREVSVRAGRAAAGDFDGDGRTDMALYRDATGHWLRLFSGTNYTQWQATVWGVPGDLPVAGDFDGDGLDDLAVYRPSMGTWLIALSTTRFSTWVAYPWGLPGDIPVPGDYDGDGLIDPAVYRPTTGYWLVLRSSDRYRSAAYWWGLPGDVPISADYDGDGKTDIAVYRPATGYWLIVPSAGNGSWTAVRWGASGDVAMPGDYDGDGKTDIAIFRPSTSYWLILQSGANNQPVAYRWGVPGDIPVPGDYDGDGTTDLAVYRPSTGNWIVSTSGSDFTRWMSALWGTSDDMPVTESR